MKILAIETSCDETSAAVVQGSRRGVRILSNIISSQIDIHKKYGGVVPEVAARNHILNIIPVIDEALKAAGQNERADLRLNTPSASERPSRDGLTPLPARGGRSKGGRIDLIAVTAGPGLMSSLLIGTQTAQMLAYVWNKPLMAVNHIEGHIYANWLKPVSVSSKFQPKADQLLADKVSAKGGSAFGGQSSKVIFPAMALVVSGGHTQLVLMRDHLKYKTIGQTRDDAAGEAFDKAAKILGLGYPGGPIISKMAENHKKCRDKAESCLYKEKIQLPRPMLVNDDFDFSFSGLKTAVLYLTKDFKNKFKDNIPENIISAICVEFQRAVIDVLTVKTLKAAKKYKAKSILLAGGVAANKELRLRLESVVKKELDEKTVFKCPEQILCTDNAAMIGAAAYYHYDAKPFSAKIPLARIKVDPNMSL